MLDLPFRLPPERSPGRRPPLARAGIRAAGLPVLTLAGTLMLAGCFGGPDAPPPSLAASRAALENVRVAEVSRFAPVPYRDARQTVEAAEAAWRGDEDYAAADRLAEQAIAQIRLAEARADAAQAEAARQDVARTLETLENEVGLSRPADAGPSPLPAPPPADPPAPGQ